MGVTTAATQPTLAGSLLVIALCLAAGGCRSDLGADLRFTEGVATERESGGGEPEPPFNPLPSVPLGRNPELINLGLDSGVAPEPETSSTSDGGLEPEAAAPDAATTEPAPEMEPVLEPTGEPDVHLFDAGEPEPVVEPSVEPAPEAGAEPEPQPEVEPEPIAQPEPAPQPEPVPQPEPMPQPEPAVQPEPVPQPEPEPEPTGACTVSGLSGDNDGLGNCFVLVTSSQSWTESRTVCRALGAGWDLAAPKSLTSNDTIRDLLVGVALPRAWVGGTDAAQEALWVWSLDDSVFWSGGPTSSGGAPVSSAFANWASDQPNAGTGSNCTSLLGTQAPGDGLWADDGCSGARPAVCGGPSP